MITIKYLEAPDEDDLRMFLFDVDSYFNPALSKKAELNSYAHKILNSGHVLAAYNEEEIVGILAYYTNDLISNTAYIPIVCVRKGFEGKHIASTLVKMSVADIKNLGMEKINIHTNNPIALKIYKNNGFSIESFDNANPVRFLLVNCL